MGAMNDYNVWLEEKGYLVWDEATDQLVWPASTLDPDKMFDEYLAEQNKPKNNNI